MKTKLTFIISLILVLSILSGCVSSPPSDTTGDTSVRDTSTKQPVSTDAEPTVTDPVETERIPMSDEPIDFDIAAPQAFVYDVATQKFLYLKGEDNILYPASTTKLLTILYALTLISPDKLVTPGDEVSLIGEGSTVAYIKPHHKLTVEMLIEGMLLPSGNDAAYALAAAAGRTLSDDPNIDGAGAVALFVAGMNEYAQSIGMTGSHFTSPDGYYDDDHYTTVVDMAVVSALAAQNELIMKYAKVQKDDVVYASGHTNTWVNTNRLLDPDGQYYSPYVTGLKTGSVGDGNYSLIVTATINGRDYIFGLFSEELINTRFVDALKILDVLEKIMGNEL